MKILCICQGGNCRSVALQFLLKYAYGQDALSVSIEANSDETKNMLLEWADKIYMLVPQFMERIPEKYLNKVTIMDLGEDIWSKGLWPELHQELYRRIESENK